MPNTAAQVSKMVENRAAPARRGRGNLSDRAEGGSFFTGTALHDLGGDGKSQWIKS